MLGVLDTICLLCVYGDRLLKIYIYIYTGYISKERDVMVVVIYRVYTYLS